MASAVNNNEPELLSRQIQNQLNHNRVTMTMTGCSVLSTILGAKLTMPRTNFLSLVSSVIIVLILLAAMRSSHMITLADDTSAPPLDLSSLANIASSIGSNPQIMGLVTSFLNQNSKQSSASSAGSLNPLLTSGSQTNSDYNNDQDVSSSSQDNQFAQSNKKLDSLKKEASSINSPPSGGNVQIINASPSQANPNSLNGLMSLLPSVLPGLSGIMNKPAKSLTEASPQSFPPPPLQPQSPTATSTVNSPSLPLTPPVTQATNQNTAQSIVNQILTAYASGQIPNELIQLGLSGKVPPQIIELALSGQVPPQIIQMIITGQVPMSTINAFLATMQGSNSNNNIPPVSNQPAQTAATTKSQSPGITRVIFEALFNRSSKSNDGTSSSSGIKVPTILGPVAIPNVRKIGQFVGGTITNVASMIPF